MISRNVFGAVPAIHPRLREPGAARLHADAWAAHGAVRVEDVLDLGVAAELVAWVAHMPFGGDAELTGPEVYWRAEIALLPGVDPQLPESLFRLARFLEEDLPALAHAITGRRLRTREPRRLDVRAWRKGSFANGGRVLAPPGGVAAILGLTGARWPAALGGHVERLCADDATLDARAPGFDTLDLFDHDQRLRVPLIVRPLEALAIHATLIAEDA